MTPAQLQKLHPECFAAVVDIGVDQERDRCCALVKGGNVSGELTAALEAVQDGRDFEALAPLFLESARNRRQQTLRALESDDAAAIVGGATPPAQSEGGDVGDAVAARVRVLLGHGPNQATKRPAAST
jgi:hypothetical protein